MGVRLDADLPKTPFILAIATLSMLCPAGAQFVQQGSKLVNPGGTFSVAISGDGATIMIGSPSDGGGAGSVQAYTRVGGAWTRQGGKLVGTGATAGAGQGQSVSLSQDGNTAIIGAPGDNIDIGAAWIFTRSNGAWTQQGNKLTGTGAIAIPNHGVFQGHAVAMSGDGNTAMLGAPGDNGGVGAAWVFTRSGNVWTEQGKLLATDAVGPTQFQGESVALSMDGNTAAVAGPVDNSLGATWVYTRSGSRWTQQGSKLVGTGFDAGSLPSVTGGVVALSADGNTLAAGGSSDGGDIGATWVFTRSAGVWSQQGKKLVGPGVVGGVAGQGSALAISGDGNTLVVGGPDDGTLFPSILTTGATWVFTRSGGVWTQQSNKLVGTGAVVNYRGGGQGTSVALSNDGQTLVTAAMNDNFGAGAAWVFDGPPAPAPLISAVESGASYLPGIVANSWVTILGTNLAPKIDDWSNSIVNGNLPTALDGVTVSMGGKAAYIYYITPGQLNVLAPALNPGPVAVTVTTASGTSASFTATVGLYGPAFFLWPGGQAVATHLDYSYAASANTFSGLTTTPAKPAEVIVLWASGFGPTNPAPPPGVEVPSNQVYATATSPTVTIGNTAALVYGAALVSGSGGLYQIAIQVPSALANGDWPVQATIGGVSSPPGTVLTVHQ